MRHTVTIDGTQTYVRLLEAFHELAPDLAPEVRRRVIAPAVRLEPGPFTLAEAVAAADVRGDVGVTVIVDGLVSAVRTVGPRAVRRLHGPGELLELGEGAVGRTLDARRPTTLALLDARIEAAVHRYPRLVQGLMRLGTAQATLAELFAAAGQLPRVEDRLLAALTSFAERWGRVTADGIVLELAVSHEELGELIGAARPTVSIGLQQLREQGRVLPLPEGFLLPHPPELDGHEPGAASAALRRVSVPER